MKKVSFARYGGPEVLELVDAPEPHAGPGQIRVAVCAAGVIPHDWRQRAGQFRGSAPLTLPAGVGQDASGIVDEVGEGVTDVAVGDRVFGRGRETYAEHAVLRAWALAPDALPLEEAAGYPSPVETALRTLEQVGVRPGETLLVSGAAGGVGSAVLQVARARGVAVIGTASTANQDYVRDLGATPTTYDAGWPGRVRALGRVDAALDLAGAGVLRELVELTGDPDRVVSVADLTAPELGVRFSGVAGDVRAALARGAELVTAGRLHLPVERVYTFADAARAHADSQAGHARGRRVIVP
ncbi:NADP-dependent oxidoreductase [Promicromonospora citrea]|uniref:Oxidoreductase n=1 Tax=Promicromonospora citrea TaxID=43677 RepID=A0A8H9GPL2_9MICO|nr:NADP-dependent oxidoreductase [Promicromonospora citrea]NNH52674.1 NADP-dependent oxidoreductase [Promicromonospora citrea]GGM44137.1 oxidoreductase [Promicromonospora citrea]